MEALILVAKTGGPTMMARIGVMRALNRYVGRVVNPIARRPIGASEVKQGERHPDGANQFL